MGYTWDVLLLMLACRTHAEPPGVLETPDEVVEYKFVLRPHVTLLEAMTTWDGMMQPAPKPDGKHAGKVWDDKDCRSIQLHPVSGTQVVRVRLEHKKKTCDSPVTNWDVTTKWLVERPEDRPPGPGETDWIAANGGVTVRYAASATVEGDGPEVEADLEALSPAACAEPVHELRWKTTHDRDVLGEPLPRATVTTWTLAGEPLATELSFKGTPGDLERAEWLRDALGPLLGEQPTSKTQALLESCRASADPI